MFKRKKNCNNIIIPSENINNEESNGNCSTLASEADNRFYKDIQKMREFIHEKYNKVSENFELTNYIGCGTGIVYEGYLKKAKKKQNFAFKFKISEKKLDKNSQEISIQKKLHHKNISEIYAFIKMDDY